MISISPQAKDSDLFHAPGLLRPENKRRLPITVCDCSLQWLLLPAVLSRGVLLVQAHKLEAVKVWSQTGVTVATIRSRDNRDSSES
ncbi:hypothetical protein Q5P01_005277 [Channa striata]|uniref:Uncharacterized protein n=1 Tax=Channa striata TaxID=64152 RepID=A0AA88T761_CHASR|nr:hypothetical protein Q5P01_005277 [Channa striata]